MRTPSLQGGKRSLSPPKKSRGTAYRDATGSTTDSITHLAPVCKKIRPAGIPPRPGFRLCTGAGAPKAPLSSKGSLCYPPIGQKTVTKYRREEGIFPAVYHFPGESKHYFQILPDFFGKNVAFSDFRWYNDDGSLGAALCCPFSKK